MKSMTGYAYLDGSINGTEMCCELKSYNSRFLDLTVNIPSTMTKLEPFFRKYFAHHIMRGKVDFYLRLQKLHGTKPISANIPLAKAYYTAISEVAHALGMERHITLELILQQEGVLQDERSFDAVLWQKKITPLLDTLIQTFNRSRMEEGRALSIDMSKMLKILSNSISEIESHADRMEALFKAMLKKKCAELMDAEPEQGRIMQEVAVMLVKYTINEEIIRAKTHIAALEKEMTQNESPGRKIDFLCQEINREVNTIGSKNQLAEIGQAVIAAKDALENIREQARNIE